MTNNLDSDRIVDAQAGFVNVFISHRQRHAQSRNAATELKRRLNLYGGSRLNVFIAEDISAGLDWRQWIEERVGQTHVLIFLYTDPEEDQGWCLLEVGKFLGAGNAQQGSVVCIHPPEVSPPSQINNLQAVQTVPTQLRKLLEDFYGTTLITQVEPELNLSFSNDIEEVSRQAQEIAELFTPVSVESRFLPNRIVLDIENTSLLHEALRSDELEVQIPDSTIITATDITLDRVFGLAMGAWNWGQLKEKVAKRGDTRWMSELARAIAVAADRETAPPVRQTFRAVNGGTIYRPMLYRVDFERTEETNEEVARRFHVLFTEEDTPKRVAGPGRVGTLFSALRTGHRFYAEVLRTYLGKLAELSEDVGKEVACKRVKEVVQIIEREAADLGVSEETMQDALGNDPDAEKVFAMMKQWEKQLRPKFFESLDQRDIPSIERFLIDFSDQNQQFMQVVSAAYSRALMK